MYNHILGYLIGLSGDGIDSDMGNIQDGILIENSGTDENIIGDELEGNYIAYNGGHGIRLSNDPFHTFIQGNLIGFTTDTLSAAGNIESGIYLEFNANYNLLGGCKCR